MLASTASESPEKTRNESQIPLHGNTYQSNQEREDPDTNLVLTLTHQVTQYGTLTKSGLLKSGNLTGRPVNEQPPGLFTQQTDRFIVDDEDMDSNTVTESDHSLKSRSFLRTVNDRVRKMQDQSSEDATQDSNKHSLIWGMFMSSTLEASIFMGKNYSGNLHSMKNTEDLTIKQMFDISEKLIIEQSGEIFGVSRISWEDSPWRQLSLVNDEEGISLSHAKVHVFSDSVLCLGKVNQNPASNTVWEEQLGCFKDSCITIQNFGHN